MTKIDKVVVSRSLVDASGWSNSRLADGTIEEVVEAERAGRDIVVVGSTSVVRALQAADLVDEYRLMVFPTVVGAGERLFGATPPVNLSLIAVDQVGPAVLSTYRR